MPTTARDPHLSRVYQQHRDAQRLWWACILASHVTGKPPGHHLARKVDRDSQAASIDAALMPAMRACRPRGVFVGIG